MALNEESTPAPINIDGDAEGTWGDALTKSGVSLIMAGSYPSLDEIDLKKTFTARPPPFPKYFIRRERNAKNIYLLL